MSTRQELLSINAVKITDQGRTFQQNLDFRVVDKELASGQLRRYVKAVKNSWSLQFTWLPGKAENTYDNAAGRDYLKAIAQTPGSVSFVVQERSGPATYIVFIQNYQETLTRRDHNFDDFFWEVSLELRQV